MGLVAKAASEIQRDPCPAGVHDAVCVAVYDLGTHVNPVFGNSQHKVAILWEIPSERIQYEKDGQRIDSPRIISQKFTLSLSEKANLRHALESWRGRKFTAQELKGFAIGKLLGVPCMLNVVHEEKKDGSGTYASIASIMPVKKGTQIKPETALVEYSIEDDGQKFPANTPKWVTEMVQKSQEWASVNDHHQAPVGSDENLEIAEDNIPF